MAHGVLKSIDGDLLEAVRRAPRRGASLAPGMWALARRPSPSTPARRSSTRTPRRRASGTQALLRLSPLLCYLETGEALAGILRRGNAASNTAGHHFALAREAFEQAASRALEELEILVRCAIGGATHACTQDCRYRLVIVSKREACVAVTSWGGRAPMV